MTASNNTIEIDNEESVEEADAAEFPVVELGVEELTRLIDTLKNTPKSDPKADQRRQHRATLHARATIIPLRESCHPGSLAILVRNLSPAGMGFLYERPMNLDEQFAMVLPRAGDTPAVVLCAVASWQPLARDLYGIGARFVRILRDGGTVPLPIEVDTTEDIGCGVTTPRRSKAS